MKKAFTLIELLVLVAIVAMLAAIIAPAVKNVKDMATAEKAVVVNITNNAAAVSQQELNKIELKPSFSGVNVEVFLSDMPTNSEIIVEDGKYYLLWGPENRDTFKTTIITSSSNMTEKRDIIIFVQE